MFPIKYECGGQCMSFFKNKMKLVNWGGGFQRVEFSYLNLL